MTAVAKSRRGRGRTGNEESHQADRAVSGEGVGNSILDDFFGVTPFEGPCVSGEPGVLLVVCPLYEGRGVRDYGSGNTTALLLNPDLVFNRASPFCALCSYAVVCYGFRVERWPVSCL